MSSAILAFGQQFEQKRDFNAPLLQKTFEKKTVEQVPFRTYGSEWFNLHSDLVGLYLIDGSTSGSPYQGMQIFPDTTIFLGVNSITSQPVSAWIHGGGDMITPSRTPSNWIESWGEVIIDSVDIWHSYVRNTPANIVDTLFIDFLKSTYGYGFYDDGDQIPELGEYFHQQVKYDYTNNRLPDSEVLRRDTVLLTVDDSSTFITGLELDVNDTIPGGDQYGMYVSFKPGYTWNANNDTITKYNSFYLISREQALDAGPNQLWAPDAAFMSYILPYDVRYNDAGSFNGSLTPTIVYNDGFDFEHHYFWYKLTSDVLSAKDININVSNVGTYPNPAVNFTNVAFELGQSDEVIIKVVDLTGREVLNVNMGTLSKGQHIKNVDLSTLKTGNYSVSVNGSSKIITVLK